MRTINGFFSALLLGMTLLFAQTGHAGSIEHQGVTRSYLLLGNPEATGPQPLIVHLHGFRKPDDFTASADLDVIQWDRLAALSTANGFLVAQPAALKGRWNMGIDLPDITLPDGQKADDIGFILKLVARLVASKQVDPARIYLSGISDGAIMANRILCESSHPFRAAASLIGTMYAQHAASCGTRKTVPMLIIAGTHDTVLPYDGWIFDGGRSMSVPETTEFWRKRLGCDGQKSRVLPDRAKRDYTRVRQIEWTGCRTPVALRLLRVEGGGHRVPSTASSKAFNWGWNGKSRDIESAQEVWNFFQDVERN